MSSSTVVALPAFASLLPLLLFDEKIRTASLFSARLASYREKLLVRCNVVTSSSPPAQRSNLKARRRRGESNSLGGAMWRDSWISMRWCGIYSVYSAGFPFVRDLSIVSTSQRASLAWISSSSFKFYPPFLCRKCHAFNLLYVEVKNKIVDFYLKRSKLIYIMI